MILVLVHLEMEVRQLLSEMFRPVRVNFPRRRFELRSLDDVIEIDIGDLNQLSKFNSNYKYILIAVNPFSKMIYTEKLKKKTARETTDAMKKILDRCDIKFKKLFSDHGTEFKNKIFQTEILEKYNIHHYFSNSIKKAMHAERYLRTLKEKLYRTMAMNATKRWIDFLPDITEKINNTPHSRFKFRPIEVTPLNEREIYEKFYSSPREIIEPKYEIGQKVRISQAENIKFRKGYWPAFSPQIYTIVARNVKKPPVYKLQDHDGNVMPRTYYTEEITPVKFPDLWLIEKILARKGNKVKVRWLGLTKDDDEWVNKNDVKDVTKIKNKKS